MVYVISPADERGRMRVARYPDRATAQRAATRSDYVVAGLSDVVWTGATLLDVYRACGGTQKFPQSWRDGAEALLDLLSRVAKEK